jgi:proteasome lid subunit RPN8/RPN11
VADPLLSFPRALWRACLGELWRRGRDLHESGCFVLGAIEGPARRAARCVYYDDLDPRAYASGVCVLHGTAFPKLWDMCRASGLSVVADIHTHRGAAFQSEADRRNPMIARQGHVALIVPRYAKVPVLRHRLGVFRYEGDHLWADFSGWRARAAICTRGERHAGR